jgi:putative membrane protein
MLKLILRALVGALGLWVASKLVSGLHVDGTATLLIAAVLLGLVNAIVRPVLFVLTLPLTVVTLGLFLFVLNAAMLGLTAALLPGFQIDGFWAAVFGAIVIGVVCWLGDMVLGQAESQR